MVISLNKLKTFFINFTIVLSSSFVLQLIKMIFNIYISNKISSEALGVFGLIMTTYMFGITLASAGLNITCMKIVAEEIALGKIDSAKKTSIKCTVIGLISGIVTGIFFCINSKFISFYCIHNKIQNNIIYLISIALPLIAMSSSINGYFMAIKKVKTNVIGSFIEQLSKIIFTYIYLRYTNLNSINDICYALILGDVFSEIISFIYLFFAYFFNLKISFNKKYKLIKKSTFSFNVNKKIYRILIPIALTSYLRSGISTIKQSLIPYSLERSGLDCAKSFSDYGIISGMALPIIMFPAIFLGIFANLFIPEFSTYYAKKDYSKIKKYTHKLIILTFIFSCIINISFWNFGTKIGIIIYKNIYIGNFIKIFSLIIPFIYIDIIIDNILKGIDAQTKSMFINIIDLVVTTSFIYFCVPFLGIKGYIVSIFLSEILNFILSLTVLLKIEKNFPNQ